MKNKFKAKKYNDFLSELQESDEEKVWSCFHTFEINEKQGVEHGVEVWITMKW